MRGAFPELCARAFVIDTTTPKPMAMPVHARAIVVGAVRADWKSEPKVHERPPVFMLVAKAPRHEGGAESTDE